jgi:hypothetical protein
VSPSVILFSLIKLLDFFVSGRRKKKKIFKYYNIFNKIKGNYSITYDIIKFYIHRLEIMEELRK